MRLPSLLLAAAAAALPTGVSAAEWYKGQMHTHSSNSSDVRTYNLKNEENFRKNDPANLARIYREKGFRFLSITDHNRPTAIPEGVTDANFIMIPGEELTTKGAHAIGLGMKSKASFKGYQIQEDVDRIRSLGGLPILAHPEYMKVVDAVVNENMTVDKIAEAKDVNLLEVYNAVCELKGGGFEPLGNSEAMWDGALSKGKLYFGNAVDDAHDWTFCGTAWTTVYAEGLDWGAIRKALENGDFYASSGVEVEGVEITKGSYAVKSRNAEKIEFIGKEGKILETVNGGSGSYTFKGDEGYVRARLSNSKIVEKPGGHKKGLSYKYGEKAWTQPVMLDQPVEKKLGTP